MIIATIFLGGQHQHDKRLAETAERGCGEDKEEKMTEDEKKLSMQIVDVGKEAKLR